MIIHDTVLCNGATRCLIPNDNFAVAVNPLLTVTWNWAFMNLRTGKKNIVEADDKGKKTDLQYEDRACIRFAHTPLFLFGSERRGLHEDGWVGEQQVGDRFVVAFSLAPVEVTFADHPCTLLAPTTVALARPETTYYRSPCNPRGQRTVFVGFDAETAFDVCSARDPSALDREDPFPARVGPSSAKSMAMAMQMERLVFAAKSNIEPLMFDEISMRIVELALDTTYQAFYTRVHQVPSKKNQQQLVDRVLALVCNDYARKWTLTELAKAAELSPAYLSRIFRLHTGRTLSECHLLIRIVRAMEQMPDRRGHLTELALECGFSSHSHMTSAFSRLLGVTPSQIVESSRGPILKVMSRLDKYMAHFSN